MIYRMSKTPETKKILLRMNITNVQNYLHTMDFRRLFLEELGWDKAALSFGVTLIEPGQRGLGRPDSAAPYVPEVLASHTFTLNAVAQKRGMTVFVCPPLQDGTIPNAPMRFRLQHRVMKVARENILVFVDADNTRQVWQWVRRGADVPVHVCEHLITPAADSKALAQRLMCIAIGIEEEEDGHITLAEVLRRTYTAFYNRAPSKKRGPYRSIRLADFDFARFDDGLRSWLEYVYSIPRLGRLEEQRLVRAAQSGDVTAMHRFLEANLYLVAEIAWKMTQFGQSYGDLLSDLMQEGYFGLLGSVKNFDPDLGYRFQSYAPLRIRNQIGRAMQDLSKTIRLPAHVHELLAKIRPQYASEADQQWQRLGREPTMHEVANGLSLTKGERKRLFLLVDQAQSLHTPELASSLQRMVDVDATHCPFSTLSQRSNSEMLMTVLQILTPQEQEILISRYGLNGEEPCTLEELSRVRKSSRERLRQMEMKALHKLRRNSYIKSIV